MQDKKMAAAMGQQSSYLAPKIEDTRTIATTFASGLDSQWGGLQDKRGSGSTVTRLTATTTNMRYPRARKSPNAAQKLAKCPCCCQAIPATELEGSRWKYVDLMLFAWDTAILTRPGNMWQTTCAHTPVLLKTVRRPIISS